MDSLFDQRLRSVRIGVGVGAQNHHSRGNCTIRRPDQTSLTNTLYFKCWGHAANPRAGAGGRTSQPPRIRQRMEAGPAPVYEGSLVPPGAEHIARSGGIDDVGISTLS